MAILQPMVIKNEPPSTPEKLQTVCQVVNYREAYDMPPGHQAQFCQLLLEVGEAAEAQATVRGLSVGVSLLAIFLRISYFAQLTECVVRLKEEALPQRSLDHLNCLPASPPHTSPSNDAETTKKLKKSSTEPRT